MQSGTQTHVVVLVERQGYHLSATLGEEAVLTLIAVTSEDPTCWEDIVACWSRYRTPLVPEFADALPFEPTDFESARNAVLSNDSWVVIDLAKKRITTGSTFEHFDRDTELVLEVDESGKQRFPLSIHLPPWWEVVERVEGTAIAWEEENSASAPRVQRDFLFGEAMIRELTVRVLDVVESAQWTPHDMNDQHTNDQHTNDHHTSDPGRSLYKLTVQVHRDWLMTPRKELGGSIPRQMLHGGIEWVDRLSWAQELRCNDGEEIVALPTNFTGYEQAPMGREEMVIYFDLCRELIAASWDWCIANGLGAHTADNHPELKDQLLAHLTEVKQKWLDDPFEGGSSPRFIIECSRRRVPRGVGVPIVGMTERERGEHITDCDCPICNMMADGMFGPTFSGLDGYHLELDDEFAFSLHKTREAWEEQQCEFAEMPASINCEMADRAAVTPAAVTPAAVTPAAVTPAIGDETETDPFASAWTGLRTEDPLPGDPQGHMKLAFLLAEVVGILQSAGATDEDVKQLNARFNDFRRCDGAEMPTLGKRLGEHVETLSRSYPELISRAADLQSRLDEQVRCLASDHDDQPR